MMACPDEFVALMEEVGLDPVRYELLIERHARYGHAVIEMPNKGDARIVKKKVSPEKKPMRQSYLML